MYFNEIAPTPRKHSNGVTLNTGLRPFGIWSSFRYLNYSFGRFIKYRESEICKFHRTQSYRIEKSYIDEN